MNQTPSDELSGMGRIEQIISKIDRENSIFAKKAVLDSLLLPSKILGRETQMEALVRFLLGHRYGHVVPFISVYGRSGSGKTTIVQHVCNELKEVEHVFVNLRRAHTIFGATNLILADLGLDTIKGSRGMLPFEKMSNVIQTRLEQSGKKLFVMVLDEFDVVFNDKRGRPSDFIYKLIELEKDLSKKGLHLCIIGISNNVVSEYDIDDRVKSRIGTSEIFFEPYFYGHVFSLLADRARDAFVNKIDDAVLRYCAKLASEEHGDARRAIDLLRVAAEIASAENQMMVSSHIDLAAKELQKDRIENVLSHSSYHFRRVLASLARVTFLSGQDWHFTSVVVQQYRKVWYDGTKLLTYRRVSEIIHEIESMGLLTSQESSRGRQGYGKQYKLVMSSHVIGQKINAAWWRDVIKAKKDHEERIDYIKKSNATSDEMRNRIEQKQAMERQQKHWNSYVMQEEDGTNE